MAYQAQDTFTGEIDGAPFTVQKGQILSSRHPLVKLDAGRGILFKPLDLGEDEPPAKRGPGRPRKAVAAGEVPADETGAG